MKNILIIAGLCTSLIAGGSALAQAPSKIDIMTPTPSSLKQISSKYPINTLISTKTGPGGIKEYTGVRTFDDNKRTITLSGIVNLNPKKKISNSMIIKYANRMLQTLWVIPAISNWGIAPCSIIAHSDDKIYDCFFYINPPASFPVTCRFMNGDQHSHGCQVTYAYANVS